MRQVSGRSAIVVALLLLCMYRGAAQQKPKPASADTVPKGRIVLIDPGLSLGRPTFLFPASLGPGPIIPGQALSYPGMTTPAWIPFTQGLAAPRVDLMRPFQLQMASERKLSTFYMVLGAMEAGAVGYMAYEHIKKYGLTK